MKFLSILAAASLALAPAFASAGSSDGNTTDITISTDDGRPISGPLAGRTLPESAVPTAAIVLGGLVLIGGAIIAIIGGNDSNNNTNGGGDEPQ